MQAQTRKTSVGDHKPAGPRACSVLLQLPLLRRFATLTASTTPLRDANCLYYAASRPQLTLIFRRTTTSGASDSKFHSEISQGTEIIEISMKFHWPKLLNFMKFCEISMPRHNTSSHSYCLLKFWLALPPKILFPRFALPL